ncbi:hypothetical protein PHLCEN_2v7931 [Hermanssonia centrifuga]|uniref:DUF3533 domain-containing protein n=1 Tax=Hermanssonia centrifuga TaxID=98765 RepID=A0A2R6NVA4_9APHY|nr:hypothetical protein PHLCEN_2v7931 [Hermanssonia centrifuga]
MFDPESKRADRPFTHGLLDRDAGTRAALKSYFKIILLSTVLISLTIWAVLGIYWGANWRVYQGIHNMNGWIVDFDGGLIGSTVTQAYLNATGSQEQVSWAVVSPNNFPNGESGVIDAVLNERCWVAVMQQPMAQAMAVFALEQARRLSPSNTSTLLGSAPELILQPLNYTIENIRPFDVQV